MTMEILRIGMWFEFANKNRGLKAENEINYLKINYLYLNMIYKTLILFPPFAPLVARNAALQGCRNWLEAVFFVKDLRDIKDERINLQLMRFISWNVV